MSKINKKEHIISYTIVKSGLICLRTDDIITFEPNPEIRVLKMEYFHENLEVYKQLTKDGKKCFLTDNRIKIDYTSEQKQFMKNQLPIFFTKVGVIIHSDFNSFVFNSFMYLYKPNIPVKSFNSMDKALVWLKS